MQKERKKGRKKGAERPTVNNPNLNLLRILNLVPNLIFLDRVEHLYQRFRMAQPFVLLFPNAHAVESHAFILQL
jgi:hypothetical protein